jgi:hypothetical protein
MDDIHDIDKDEFFARLTDEAATPDPRFIESLRVKVNRAAGSTGGSGNLFGGLKHFVIVAVISAASLIGFTTIQNTAPSANTSAPVDEPAVVTGNRL